ncbi:unnamed protein product [Amoebophrya sp. A120]|nr:unnamed protein product [Amoebophrya sp. A120]|eukprot:GSA120T00021898001.1
MSVAAAPMVLHKNRQRRTSGATRPYSRFHDGKEQQKSEGVQSLHEQTAEAVAYYPVGNLLPTIRDAYCSGCLLSGRMEGVQSLHDQSRTGAAAPGRASTSYKNLNREDPRVEHSRSRYSNCFDLNSVTRRGSMQNPVASGGWDNCINFSNAPRRDEIENSHSLQIPGTNSSSSSSSSSSQSHTTSSKGNQATRQAVSQNFQGWGSSKNNDTTTTRTKVGASSASKSGAAGCDGGVADHMKISCKGDSHGESSAYHGRRHDRRRASTFKGGRGDVAGRDDVAGLASSYYMNSTAYPYFGGGQHSRYQKNEETMMNCGQNHFQPAQSCNAGPASVLAAAYDLSTCSNPYYSTTGNSSDTVVVQKQNGSYRQEWYQQRQQLSSEIQGLGSATTVEELLGLDTKESTRATVDERANLNSNAPLSTSSSNYTPQEWEAWLQSHAAFADCNAILGGGERELDELVQEQATSSCNVGLMNHCSQGSMKSKSSGTTLDFQGNMSPDEFVKNYALKNASLLPVRTNNIFGRTSTTTTSKIADDENKKLSSKQHISDEDVLDPCNIFETGTGGLSEETARNLNVDLRAGNVGTSSCKEEDAAGTSSCGTAVKPAPEIMAAGSSSCDEDHDPLEITNDCQIMLSKDDLFGGVSTSSSKNECELNIQELANWLTEVAEEDDQASAGRDHSSTNLLCNKGKMEVDHTDCYLRNDHADQAHVLQSCIEEAACAFILPPVDSSVDTSASASYGTTATTTTSTSTSVLQEQGEVDLTSSTSPSSIKEDAHIASNTNSSSSTTSNMKSGVVDPKLRKLWTTATGSSSGQAVPTVMHAAPPPPIPPLTRCRRPSSSVVPVPVGRSQHVSSSSSSSSFGGTRVVVGPPLAAKKNYKRPSTSLSRRTLNKRMSTCAPAGKGSSSSCSSSSKSRSTSQHLQGNMKNCAADRTGAGGEGCTYFNGGTPEDDEGAEQEDDFDDAHASKKRRTTLSRSRVNVARTENYDQRAAESVAPGPPQQHLLSNRTRPDQDPAHLSGKKMNDPSGVKSLPWFAKRPFEPNLMDDKVLLVGNAARRPCGPSACTSSTSTSSSSCSQHMINVHPYINRFDTTSSTRRPARMSVALLRGRCPGVSTTRTDESSSTTRGFGTRHLLPAFSSSSCSSKNRKSTGHLGPSGRTTSTAISNLMPASNSHYHISRCCNACGKRWTSTHNARNEFLPKQMTSTQEQSNSKNKKKETKDASCSYGCPSTGAERTSLQSRPEDLLHHASSSCTDAAASTSTSTTSRTSTSVRSSSSRSPAWYQSLYDPRKIFCVDCKPKHAILLSVNMVRKIFLS